MKFGLVGFYGRVLQHVVRGSLTTIRGGGSIYLGNLVRVVDSRRGHSTVFFVRLFSYFGRFNSTTKVGRNNEFIRRCALKLRYGGSHGYGTLLLATQGLVQHFGTLFMGAGNFRHLVGTPTTFLQQRTWVFGPRDGVLFCS